MLDMLAISSGYVQSPIMVLGLSKDAGRSFRIADGRICALPVNLDERDMPLLSYCSPILGLSISLGLKRLYPIITPTEFSQISGDVRIAGQPFLLSSDDPIEGFGSVPSVFLRYGLFGSSDASERFILNPPEKLIPFLISDGMTMCFSVIGKSSLMQPFQARDRGYDRHSIASSADPRIPSFADIVGSSRLQ
jgi:hypothetical protein